VRTVPWGRGENDCRICGRGGNEAFFKTASRSGDDIMAMCGLSDDGSVGAIRHGEE
jgi:hypothetical protein